jgi:hypothetical protein
MAESRIMRRLLKTVAVIGILAAYIVAAGFISPAKQPYSINVAVLYSGSSGSYRAALQHFSQPELMNLAAAAVDADKMSPGGLKGYDIVYPDASVRNSKNSATIKQQIMEYASAGRSHVGKQLLQLVSEEFSRSGFL